MEETKEVLVQCWLCNLVKLVRLVYGNPKFLRCERCRGMVEILEIDGKKQG